MKFNVLQTLCRHKEIQKLTSNFWTLQVEITKPCWTLQQEFEKSYHNQSNKIKKEGKGKRSPNPWSSITLSSWLTQALGVAFNLQHQGLQTFWSSSSFLKNPHDSFLSMSHKIGKRFGSLETHYKENYFIMNLLYNWYNWLDC